MSIERIKDNISDLKKGEFPKNLELIDAYFDETYGSNDMHIFYGILFI